MNSLNQVIQRLKTIALAHRQVRSFKHGLTTDFFTDHTTKYPAVLLQDNGGVVSTKGHKATVNFRMFIMDLVHVAQDTKDNELDVQSDMLNIAMDLLAQMNSGDYNDWLVSLDDNIQLVVENDNDLHAGCIVDFSISIMFKQNLCAVPSDLAYEVISEEMASKEVFNTVYTATGEEGSTLTTDSAGNVPYINGKKLILVIRSTTALTPVSNLPASDEYTWDNEEVGLGTPTNEGEKFLFVYRNY